MDGLGLGLVDEAGHAFTAESSVTVTDTDIEVTHRIACVYDK